MQIIFLPARVQMNITLTNKYEKQDQSLFVLPIDVNYKCSSC